MEWIIEFSTRYLHWLQSHDISVKTSLLIKEISFFILMFLFIWFFDLLLRRIVLRIITIAAKKTKNEWDDVLIENRVIKRILHLVPAFIFHEAIPELFVNNKFLIVFFQSSVAIYAIWMVMSTFSAFFKSVNQIYMSSPRAKERSIKGYLQVGSIIVYFIGGIAIVSVLVGKSMGILLGGLGAFAAVLMLVFKDSILGLVGGIQLSSNDMLRPGDWISMPSNEADGIVQEIGLTIVKVQNFDKTIVTIPTYTLVSNSFQNWRNMELSGARRFKRFIFIDQNSITFCTNKFIEKIKSLEPDLNIFKDEHFDLTTYTNFGIFRHYAKHLMLSNVNIHSELTILAKQLQPTDKGIPLEIVAFSKILENEQFEELQAQLIERLIAVLPIFDLRLFQSVGGFDLKN